MNRRNIIILVLVILILAGAGIGYSKYKAHEKAKNFITYKDPNFTDQEKQAIQKQLTDAENTLNNLPKNASTADRYRATIQVGLINYELGNFQAAKDTYKKAVALDKKNASAYHELYVVERSMMDYDEAKINIEKAVQLAGNNPQYWRDRVELMRTHFNYTDQQTQALYQDALNATNNATDVITSFAQFLEQKGDLQGAVTQWKAAIKQNPSATAAYQQEIDRIQAKLK